jgi:hypothetical protein
MAQTSLATLVGSLFALAITSKAVMTWILIGSAIIYLLAGVILELRMHGGRSPWGYERAPTVSVRIFVIMFWPMILFFLWIDWPD